MLKSLIDWMARAGQLLWLDSSRGGMAVIGIPAQISDGSDARTVCFVTIEMWGNICVLDKITIVR
jgi:hypothetical protein